MSFRNLKKKKYQREIATDSFFLQTCTLSAICCRFRQKTCGTLSINLLWNGSLGKENRTSKVYDLRWHLSRSSRYNHTDIKKLRQQSCTFSLGKLTFRLKLMVSNLLDPLPLTEELFLLSDSILTPVQQPSFLMSYTSSNWLGAYVYITYFLSYQKRKWKIQSKG